MKFSHPFQTDNKKKKMKTLAMKAYLQNQVGFMLMT